MLIMRGTESSLVRTLWVISALQTPLSLAVPLIPSAESSNEQICICSLFTKQPFVTPLSRRDCAKYALRLTSMCKVKVHNSHFPREVTLQREEDVQWQKWRDKRHPRSTKHICFPVATLIRYKLTVTIAWTLKWNVSILHTGTLT